MSAEVFAVPFKVLAVNLKQGMSRGGGVHGGFTRGLAFTTPYLRVAVLMDTFAILQFQPTCAYVFISNDTSFSVIPSEQPQDGVTHGECAPAQEEAAIRHGVVAF